MKIFGSRRITAIRIRVLCANIWIAEIVAIRMRGWFENYFFFLTVSCRSRSDLPTSTAPRRSSSGRRPARRRRSQKLPPPPHLAPFGARGGLHQLPQRTPVTVTSPPPPPPATRHSSPHHGSEHPALLVLSPCFPTRPCLPIGQAAPSPPRALWSLQGCSNQMQRLRDAVGLNFEV